MDPKSSSMDPKSSSMDPTLSSIDLKVDLESKTSTLDVK
jgi:hypothetical protein